MHKFTKIGLVVLVAAILLVSVGSAAARANDKGNANEPRVKEKMVFIHYKKDKDNGNAKPPWVEEKNKDKTPDSSCYGFLANGVKWKSTPVNYVIDPDNYYGMSEGYITGAIQESVETWDANTSTELFGGWTIDHDATWDGDNGDVPDGRNEFVFDNYLDPNVIAITVTWGYFSGPPKQREITEFDVLFNTQYWWGDSDTNSGFMDLKNIAVHETGHGIGLGDLYETTCMEETMYGYSDYDETKKRTLNVGDITGLQKLYGA